MPQIGCTGKGRWSIADPSGVSLPAFIDSDCLLAEGHSIIWRWVATLALGCSAFCGRLHEIEEMDSSCT
jgi:hypothetical protein